MPETTINSSPLSPSAEITSTSLAIPSRVSKTSTTTSELDAGSVANRSDIPETSTGQLPNESDRDYSHKQHEVALTFVDKVKEIMSDNQLVINTFIAGGLAGATSRTVVSPLERLKIIL